MIDEIRIQGIGVIAEASIAFAPGFTVITGETGAGKTMVLTGLDLLRGSRADMGALREADGTAEVDAVATLPERPSSESGVGAALEGLGIPAPEDGRLITRRTVASGGSRAYLAGRPVTVGDLARVWAGLVVVHGQLDQARLREQVWQRDIVDRFGGPSLQGLAQTYRAVWQQWQATQADLKRLTADVNERERLAGLLRMGMAEIDDVEPELGEDDELDAESAVLTHVGTLRDAAEATRFGLTGGENEADTVTVVSRLVGARDALEQVADLDERLADLAARLNSILVDVSDVDGEVGDYLRGLDADPQRQAWVEDRRARLAALRKSYGPTLEDVIQWRADAAKQIAEADGAEARIAELTQREAELSQEARELAEGLSAARRASADRLTGAVQSELIALAMPNARVEIQIESDHDPSALRGHGADEIRIMMVPHPGAPARPIGKGASGGELSRLALAFEVAMAGDSPTPTMVFDEVDAGVGGAVAVEVGRRLARLARHVQVVVVTHLPQVAAFAERHLVVTKSGDGFVTASGVRHVDGQDRVDELVRMLSGLKGSSTGAAHAEELLEVGRLEASQR